MNIRRITVGIDLSKDEFHACILFIDFEGKSISRGTSKFTNALKGFNRFSDWIGKRVNTDDERYCVMEATGVYYENLAYYLHAHGHKVVVVLGNKMKNFIRSLNIKTKTDKVDARLIAEYGGLRSLDLWEPMSKTYKELRDHTRELLRLKKDLTRHKSQLHAMLNAYETSEKTISLKQAQIDFEEGIVSSIMQDLQKIARQNTTFYKRLKLVMTIPGIGFETAITIISETNGFQLFHCAKQVASYAGLDVRLNESGYFKGRARISKMGNSRIRKVLFMPALAASRHNPSLNKLYTRICLKNPGSKHIGLVAVMRKLLLLTYIIWTRQVCYDVDYKWNSGD